jgi:glycosyltransferase involved in cell wall biosynthesis
MRIAILGSRGYPSTYSGFETLVRELAPALAERGHEVTVYGRHRRPGTAEQWHDGVRVVATPAIPSKSLSTISGALTSGRHARREGFDCAVAVNLATVPIAMRLQAAGCPVVLNVDGIEWQRRKWGRVGRLTFRGLAEAAVRSSVTLVADSRAIQAYYYMTFGRTPEYISYGSHAKHLDDDRHVRRLSLSSGAYLLVVARVTPENQIDLILDAYLDSGVEQQLVVVGSANYGSPTERRLRDLAAARRIVWLGHVADQALLEQLWAHTALYIHGHSVGGTNPSLLQALGLGAPTLAFDSPFNREVLGDDDRYFFSREAGDLGRAIREVTTGERTTIGGEDARERVRAAYAWPAVVESYEELLRELAAP